MHHFHCRRNAGSVWVFFINVAVLLSYSFRFLQISNLEKEGRDSQRKLFDVQRERDDASSQLRKLEAERTELRKRVNEVCFVFRFLVLNTANCVKPYSLPMKKL